MIPGIIAWNRQYNPLVSIQFNGVHALDSTIRYNEIVANGNLYFDSLYANYLKFNSECRSIYTTTNPKKVKVKYIEASGNLTLKDCEVDIDVLIGYGSISFENCTGRIGKIYGGYETDNLCSIHFDESYLTDTTYLRGNCTARLIVHQMSYFESSGTASIENLYGYQTTLFVTGSSNVTNKLWLESGYLQYDSINPVGLQKINIANCAFNYMGTISDLSIEVYQNADVILNENTTINNINSLGKVYMKNGSTIQSLNTVQLTFIDESEDVVKNVSVNGITQILESTPINSTPLTGSLIVDPLHEVLYVFEESDIDFKAEITRPFLPSPVDKNEEWLNRTGEDIYNFIY